MSLLSSLEKFGFSPDEELDITAEHKKEEQKIKEANKVVQKVPKEQDYLVSKTIKCPVCDYKFKTLMVRGSKARRLEPDFDLRPRYENIDILKYDVTMCPNCGYASMNRTFAPLTDAQVGRITQQIRSKFHGQEEKELEVYTYDEAIDRFKLALVSAMVKYVKLSEKSYLCLKISWLLREKLKTMTDFSEDDLKAKKEVQAEMEGFYRQAYDGFLTAIQKEMPPYCGMNTTTMNFLLANMSVFFKDTSIASKYIYELLGSPNTSQRIKDRCLELKAQLQESS